MTWVLLELRLRVGLPLGRLMFELPTLLVSLAGL
jgi:hypothetical protein